MLRAYFSIYCLLLYCGGLLIFCGCSFFFVSLYRSFAVIADGCNVSQRATMVRWFDCCCTHTLGYDSDFDDCYWWTKATHHTMTISRTLFRWTSFCSLCLCRFFFYIFWFHSVDLMMMCSDWYARLWHLNRVSIAHFHVCRSWLTEC